MAHLSFPADHPALMTGVGERSAGTLRVEAESGCGLYGPYVDLPAGPCVARIRFRGPRRGYALVDLAAEVGEKILAARVVDLNSLVGDVAEIAAIVPTPLSNCEVRLFCRADVRVEIAAVEIESGDYALVERIMRDDLSGATATNDGIQKGRNLAAGYARGQGIEIGGLRSFVIADPDWQAALRASRGRSIITAEKLMNLFLIMKYSTAAEGNVIEFGSFRGGGALFLASLAKRLRKDCKVYALDTFEGMPPTDSIVDRHSRGNFADVDFAGLKQARDEEGLDNLILLRGLFQDTVKLIAPEERRFFLSHIDCDIYESVVFSTEFAKRHAVYGSHIVFDDPLSSDCLGAMQAMEECLSHQGLFAEQAYPHLVFRYPPLT
jgi:hypothetical protein